MSATDRLHPAAGKATQPGCTAAPASCAVMNAVENVHFVNKHERQVVRYGTTLMAAAYTAGTIVGVGELPGLEYSLASDTRIIMTMEFNNVSCGGGGGGGGGGGSTRDKLGGERQLVTFSFSSPVPVAHAGVVTLTLQSDTLQLTSDGDAINRVVTRDGVGGSVLCTPSNGNNASDSGSSSAGMTATTTIKLTLPTVLGFTATGSCYVVSR